jgi:hypothetical protein
MGVLLGIVPGKWPTSKDKIRALIMRIQQTDMKFRLRHGESLLSAMTDLFFVLSNPESGSTKKMLQDGKLPVNRVVAYAEPDEKCSSGLVISGEPDTLVATFNSPLGPEVLVATDRLSEGLDLHRYCRYLVHYELPYSPIRVFQRNGRIRRLHSWAAEIDKPIQYQYPVLRGTRDERLSDIVSRRVGFVTHLLGGVGVKVRNLEEIGGSAVETYRIDALQTLEKELVKVARGPSTKLSVIN